MQKTPVTPERLSTACRVMREAATSEGYAVEDDKVHDIADTLLSQPNSMCAAGQYYPFDVEVSPQKTMRITIDAVSGGSKRVKINRCVDGQTLNVDTRATKCAKSLKFNAMVEKDYAVEWNLKQILPPEEQANLDLHDTAWYDESGRLVLESKYCGPDLTDFKLDDDDDDPVATVLDLFERFALGLDSLHRISRIHSDVKPGNMLSGGKLTDFGFVHCPRPDIHRIKGTPYYLPSTMFSSLADQAAMLGKEDASIDAFGFSVSLYQVLHGILLPHLLKTRAQKNASVKTRVNELLWGARHQKFRFKSDEVSAAAADLLQKFGRHRVRYIRKIGDTHTFQVHPDYESAHGDFLEIVDLLALSDGEKGCLEETIGRCFMSFYGPLEDRTTINDFVKFFARVLVKETPAAATSSSPISPPSPLPESSVLLGRKRKGDELDYEFSKRCKHQTL